MHVTTQAFRTLVPQQHWSAFDKAMAACPDEASEVQATGILQKLIALLLSMGQVINWQCVISIIPLVLAAFSTGAWGAVLAAYFACASPTPTP